jgi:hypothetical protein
VIPSRRAPSPRRPLGGRDGTAIETGFHASVEAKNDDGDVDDSVRMIDQMANREEGGHVFDPEPWEFEVVTSVTFPHVPTPQGRRLETGRAEGLTTSLVGGDRPRRWCKIPRVY